MAKIEFIWFLSWLTTSVIYALVDELVEWYKIHTEHRKNQWQNIPRPSIGLSWLSPLIIETKLAQQDKVIASIAIHCLSMLMHNFNNPSHRFRHTFIIVLHQGYSHSTVQWYFSSSMNKILKILSFKPGEITAPTYLQVCPVFSSTNKLWE